MAETVGLALAVLPILFSAAEYYRDGLDSLQTLRPKVGDDRILEFYEEVAFEIFLLRSCIKKLVKDLPGFSPEYKRELLRSVRPERWSDEALSDALQAKLGEINYPMFDMTLSRLLMALNALISSNQQLLSSFEVVSLQQHNQPIDPIASASDTVLTFRKQYRSTRAFSVVNLACSGRT
jgi:hypothetical protein